MRQSLKTSTKALWSESESKEDVFACVLSYHTSEYSDGASDSSPEFRNSAEKYALEIGRSDR
jgi:hypothetical protein